MVESRAPRSDRVSVVSTGSMEISRDISARAWALTAVAGGLRSRS